MRIPPNQQMLLLLLLLLLLYVVPQALAQLSLPLATVASPRGKYLERLERLRHPFKATMSRQAQWKGVQPNHWHPWQVLAGDRLYERPRPPRDVKVTLIKSRTPLSLLALTLA